MPAWENYDASLRLVLKIDSWDQIWNDRFSGTDKVIQLVKIPYKLPPEKQNKKQLLNQHNGAF